MAEQEPFARQDTEVFPTGEVPGGATATDEPARRRDVDPVSLVAGLVFILLALLVVIGVEVPVDWFGHGIAWIALIGAGLALLVNELRRSRHRDRT